MFGILGSSVDILIQFSSIFLCRRYVFLEKGFERKKQHYYNLATICLLLVFNFIFGDTVAQVLLFFIGGLNIAFSRKKHRIRGFFLIIPIAGIINGIIVVFKRCNRIANK